MGKPKIVEIHEPDDETFRKNIDALIEEFRKTIFESGVIRFVVAYETDGGGRGTLYNPGSWVSDYEVQGFLANAIMDLREADTEIEER